MIDFNEENFELFFTYVRLEKYANLNFTGFHKILKKHDKRLTNPCQKFYLERLKNQAWVEGGYSDIIVSMSRVYSAIRGDEVNEPVESDRQVQTPCPTYSFHIIYVVLGNLSRGVFFSYFILILRRVLKHIYDTRIEFSCTTS